MSTSFYNLFQNSVISVSTRNYTFILKRLSTNIDFIQCLLTNKQSLRTTVQLLQYKEPTGATPNFKILQTFFSLSLYGISRYFIYHIQQLSIIYIISLTLLIYQYDYLILYNGLFLYIAYSFRQPIYLHKPHNNSLIVYIKKQKQRHPNGWRCSIRICVPQSGVQGTCLRPL